MEASAISWDIIISVVSVAIIACLSVLLFQAYRKLTQVRIRFGTIEKRLEEELRKQNQLSAQLMVLQTDYNENVLVDPVTQLPSFRVFEDRLQQTVFQSQRHQFVFAILFLDIDDFKIINNVLGAETGNLLLQELVSRLQGCIRKVDSICHFMSSGFAFILPQLAKPETAAYVAQRLLDAVSQPFLILNHELFVTASIGITTYPADGLTESQLLNNVEIALHQAKSRGHNMYQFYREDLYTLSHRELILSSSLRSDSVYKEFMLHYQPLINVVTKEIISMEALLRWQHPELGLVPPQDFIRLAENNGCISAIGDWVLRAACSQFKKWHAQGFHLRNITVNVSLWQLENSNFTHKISHILQEFKIEPACLMLEISEGVLLPKLSQVEKTLHMLKHLGVQIAIDDFGTGYLSLRHLRRFPVTCLKIDNTLVQEMMIDNESTAIVKTIISLAKSLQLETVAEGVESDKQKELLKEYGCVIMQGFIFSRPLPAEEFTSVLLQTITTRV